MYASEEMLEFVAVSKSFGATRALDDVSFEIPAGSRVGLLGPNGSGKTTALRVILGLFRADSGSVRVFGAEPSHQAAEAIGYLPEERGLYREMKVLDLLRYYARLKGARPSEAAIDDWLERLDIARYKHQRVRALSKGTAQKVQFISTVLHDPELVILDEPFSGLDPLSRQLLARAFDWLSSLGKTLVFSTHDMTTADALCDRFLMLHQGKKVLDESRAGLAQLTGRRVVRVVTEPALPASLPEAARRVERAGRTELSLRPDVDPQQWLRRISRDHAILRFEVGQPSLEDIFLSLAGAADPSDDSAR